MHFSYPYLHPSLPEPTPVPTTNHQPRTSSTLGEIVGHALLQSLMVDGRVITLALK